MIITLSPSKGQDFEAPGLSKTYTKPADLKDSELLIKELRKIKSKKLQEMMAISENIASLNVGRYKKFKTPFTTKNAKQAIFAFKGDVYSGLALDEFTDVFGQWIAPKCHKPHFMISKYDESIEVANTR